MRATIYRISVLPAEVQGSLQGLQSKYSKGLLRPLKVFGSRSVMTQASEVPALVEASWLNERLEAPGVKVLDGSWFLPDAGRNGSEEFLASRIPGSRFFDLNAVSDKSSSLPHMLPSEAVFASVMDALQISKEDTVVIYDRAGIFSAPRIWWTFKVFGHQSVAVLNGGFPAWQAKDFKIDDAAISKTDVENSAKGAQNPSDSTNYKAQLQRDMVVSMQDVLENIESQDSKVLDARGAPRFNGEAQEPRPGMKKGHIPKSTNVPFSSLLDSGRYKEKNELEAIFSKSGVDWEKPIISSCGSGVTACVVALGLYQVKPQLKVAVYDGSWSEWGSSKETPVETS